MLLENPSTSPSPQAFSTQDLQWLDTARNRRVPARLFWPEGASSDNKVPLVVFSHGIGSSLDGYTYLGRHWAANGVASLHLQHVGSDRSLWQGGVLSMIQRFQKALTEQEAIDRVHDLRFALDSLLEGEHGPYIAQDQIVAAGHSYGANTTMLAAGAKFMRNGEVMQFRNERITAAILISAPPFYGEKCYLQILSEVSIPTLHVTTLNDIIRIPGFGSGLKDRLKVFEAMGGPHKTLAVYKQGSHTVFTEQRYFDSLEIATEVKTATEGLSLAFLDQVFGRSASLEDWGQQNRALFSQFVSAIA